MKHSIRTRFSLGMIFLFIIILVLSFTSGYFLNKLSNKTSAILKENFLSVVYANEMSEGIIKINQELISGFLAKRTLDNSRIAKNINLINNSLLDEKNNITEPGEDKLVSDIETGYDEYRDSVMNIIKSPKSPKSVDGMLYIQNKTGDIYRNMLLLSRMNERALQSKTDDAKASARHAMIQMTILATMCFLIALGFTYSFASYFNQRFSQLYSGIKEIVSSNYDQHIFFDGRDEFYEISLLLNEMANKLNENKQKMSVTLHKDIQKEINPAELEELRKMLLRIKSMEEQVADLIFKFNKG